MLATFFVAIWLFHCGVASDDTSSANNQNNGLLESVVNGIRLNLRNVVEKVFASVDAPRAINPPYNDDISLHEITLPPVLGGARLLPIGCPRCAILDSKKLFGTWRLIYASDNFIKLNMMQLAKLTEDTKRKQEETTASNDEKSASDFKSVFNPTKFPVCVKFQIGQPISYGFLMDFPLQFAFKLGTPSGPLHVGYGVLRLFQDGKLVLVAANGAYTLRLCVIESNIKGSFPSELEPIMSILNVTDDLINATASEYVELFKGYGISNPSHASSVENPYFMILADPSGFPACRNYIILVNDELAYMKKYDKFVGELLRRMSVDTDSNPLQYLGCPCGFTAY